MKTKAAILFEQNKPLQIEEITLPKLKQGQILVRLYYSGVCRSQLNEMKGFKGKDPYLPHTLGHEGSGIVLEVGPDVSKVKKDDSVVLTWIKGKGFDIPNCEYELNGTVIQSGAISTFLQYAVISENRVVKIPKQVPFEQAALLGCAYLTGAGIVHHQLKVKKEQSLAIFGVGGIGMSSLIAAKMKGANPLIAIDINENKLSKAMQLGSTHLIRADKENPLVKILEITNQQGVNFAIECAGQKKAMEEAFKCINNKGRCVLAGNLKNNETIAIDPFELIKGKLIFGSWGGSSNVDEDIPYFAQMILEKKLCLKGLISDIVSLSQVNDLFNRLDQGNIQRGLIKFD